MVVSGPNPTLFIAVTTIVYWTPGLRLDVVLDLTSGPRDRVVTEVGLMINLYPVTIRLTSAGSIHVVVIELTPAVATKLTTCPALGR